jgi:transposase-like protein
MNIDYSLIKYLIFDGTYFKHTNCLMLGLDNDGGLAVNHRYCYRENYSVAKEIFEELKGLGVEPKAITTDGNTCVIRAVLETWPHIIVQRCLVHIQRQGLSWLRRKPKLEAGQQLRDILLTVTNIKTYEDKRIFIELFERWERKFGSFVQSLPAKDKVYSDLQATRRLIVNASADMFHYLEDHRIASTTNKIEGYFSNLKELYGGHHGLFKKNKKSYLNWYIYFNNIKKITNKLPT